MGRQQSLYDKAKQELKQGGGWGKWATILPLAASLTFLPAQGTPQAHENSQTSQTAKQELQAQSEEVKEIKDSYAGYYRAIYLLEQPLADREFSFSQQWQRWSGELQELLQDLPRAAQEPYYQWALKETEEACQDLQEMNETLWEMIAWHEFHLRIISGSAVRENYQQLGVESDPLIYNKPLTSLFDLAEKEIEDVATSSSREDLKRELADLKETTGVLMDTIENQDDEGYRQRDMPVDLISALEMSLPEERPGHLVDYLQDYKGLLKSLQAQASADLKNLQAAEPGGLIGDIIFAHDDTVYLLDPDSGDATKLPTAGNMSTYMMDLAPDRTLVAYSATNTDNDQSWLPRIYIKDRGSGETRWLAGEDDFALGLFPDFSPSGDRLVYVKNYSVYVRDLVTGEEKLVGEQVPINRIEKGYSDLKEAEQVDRIPYSSGGILGGGNFPIAMYFDRGEAFFFKEWNNCPDWSPDGDYLAYGHTHYRGGLEEGSYETNLVITDIDGSWEKEIPLPGEAVAGIDWSPWGHSLLIATYDYSKEEPYQLYMARFDEPQDHFNVDHVPDVDFNGSNFFWSSEKDKFVYDPAAGDQQLTIYDLSTGEKERKELPVLPTSLSYLGDADD